MQAVFERWLLDRPVKPGDDNGTVGSSVAIAARENLSPPLKTVSILLPPRPPRGRFARRRRGGTNQGGRTLIRVRRLWWPAPANPDAWPVRRLRVWLRKPGTRAAPGLRPGPLGVPARSWLTTVRSLPNAFPSRRLWSGRGSGALTAKARPGDRTNAAMARRKAPRVPTRDASQLDLRFSARHSPRLSRWGDQQSPDACPRRGDALARP